MGGKEKENRLNSNESKKIEQNLNAFFLVVALSVFVYLSIMAYNLQSDLKIEEDALLAADILSKINKRREEINKNKAAINFEQEGAIAQNLKENAELAPRVVEKPSWLTHR